MKLKFHGVRGSRPTHKPGLLGYGGNSTSLEILLESEDFYLFIDGGSGIATRGRELGENPDKKHFHVFITHTHWDHILGFPFFNPIYGEDNSFSFHASNTSKSTFNELFFGLQRSENLPVPITKLKAKMEFKSIAAGDEVPLGKNVKVRTMQINHQGITLAYRIENGKDSMAIITDNAPIEGNYMGEGMQEQAASNPEKFENKFNHDLTEFLRDCNTVVFDTHFTEENLKADWGHSTPQQALQFCKDANVSRLVLFHHAPEDLDRDVDNKVQSVLEDGKKSNIEVVAAKEGDVWHLRCA